MHSVLKKNATGKHRYNHSGTATSNALFTPMTFILNMLVRDIFMLAALDLVTWIWVGWLLKEGIKRC